MKITAALLTLLSLSQAIIIPDDTPDGLLVASIDPNPNSRSRVSVKMLYLHNSTEIDTPSEKAPGLPSRLARRTVPLPVTKHGCQSDWLDPSDWDLAKNRFGIMCDKGQKIPANSILAYKVGADMAYGCSFGSDNPCSSLEYDWFSKRMDDYYCTTDMTTGWLWMDSWQKTYGRDLVVNSVCTNLDADE